MSIEIHLDAERTAWDGYVDAHHAGTPYHCWSWTESLEQCFGHEPVRIAATLEGRLIGVLPVVIVRSRLTGTRLISTPFAGYGGPIADSPQVAEMLIEHAASLADELGADHLALHFASNELVPPSAADMATTDLYWAFRAYLPSDPDDILPMIPAKARRMIRLAKKSGLVAESLVEDTTNAPMIGSQPLQPRLRACYDLLSRTMRDLGTPVYPMSYLQHLTRSDPQRWLVFAARDGDRIAAAVWVGVHANGMYPHFVGADRDYFKVGGSNFLYWGLMSTGVANGFGMVDMGRSKKGTGPYHFKRHMGMDPEPLGYRYHLAAAKELPEINPNNPRYSAAISLWRQLPLGVVNLVGPRLIGHFA